LERRIFSDCLLQCNGKNHGPAFGARRSRRFNATLQMDAEAG